MKTESEKRPIFAQGEAPGAVELAARAKVLDILAAEIRLTVPPELVSELVRALLVPSLGPVGVAQFVGGMFRGAFGNPRVVSIAVAGIRAAREELS